MIVVKILMCVIIIPFWIKLGIEVGEPLTGGTECDLGKCMYHGLAYVMATIVMLAGMITLFRG